MTHIDLVLQRIRTTEGGGAVDLHVRDHRIVAIVPTGGDVPEATTVVDGGSQFALPGLVDAHAHVDKTMWGLPWRPHSAEPGDVGASQPDADEVDRWRRRSPKPEPGDVGASHPDADDGDGGCRRSPKPDPGLAGLIANEQAGRRSLPPVRDRAAALFDAYLVRGTTIIRTHVDVDTDQSLEAIEGVLAAAEERRDVLDVEVVAFPQSGMLVAPGTAELLEAAVRAGAHLVGGIDPAGFDGDAVRHLDTIFAIADRHGVGVDLHLHDRGSLGRWQVGLVVERTRALGMQGHVTISHAFALCDDDPAVPALLDELAEADIALTTVAPGNVPPLPLEAIHERGIRVGLGQDGIRDLWSPWGDADMLARAGLLSWRAGHRRDEDLATSVALATTRGAKMLGREDHGLRVGGRADIVVVDVAGAAEAAVLHPERSLVIAGGRIISAGGTTTPVEG